MMIVVEDEKTVLKLRSLGGGTEENGKIILHPLEAIYFVNKRVIKQDVEELFRQAGDLAEERYHVLEFLRENGYISKPSFKSGLLRIYRKGFRPGEDRTYSLVKVIKDEKLSPEDLEEFSRFAGELRKEAVIAIVKDLDEEPVFFRLSRTKFE